MGILLCETRFCAENQQKTQNSVRLICRVCTVLCLRLSLKSIASKSRYVFPTCLCKLWYYCGFLFNKSLGVAFIDISRRDWHEHGENANGWAVCWVAVTDEYFVRRLHKIYTYFGLCQNILNMNSRSWFRTQKRIISNWKCLSLSLSLCRKPFKTAVFFFFKFMISTFSIVYWKKFFADGFLYISDDLWI